MGKTNKMKNTAQEKALLEMPVISITLMREIARAAYDAGVLHGRAEARCEIYKQEPLIDMTDGARGMNDASCPF